MYSGCSASSGSGGHSRPSTFASQSCHQTSRPSCIATSLPVRRTTTTCCTLGVSRTASSMLAFRGTTLPRRKPPSAVIIAFAWQSFTRSRIESGLNPAKITVCGAPIRAQASMMIGSSGTIGR